MNEQKLNMNHTVILENRNKLSIGGVLDVLGFDDETVSLSTEMGNLIVKGNGLRVQSFTTETGHILVEGNIAAMIYTEQKSKLSIKSRLFR